MRELRYIAAAGKSQDRLWITLMIMLHFVGTVARCLACSGVSY